MAAYVEKAFVSDGLHIDATMQPSAVELYQCSQIESLLVFST